jgi:hypothetical protein
VLRPYKGEESALRMLLNDLEPEVAEKLEYMHANLVTRKLVKHPKDWPWSSWGFNTRIGKVLVQIDV